MENRKIIEIGEILEKANTGLDAIKRAPIVEYDSGIKCLRIQDVSQSKKFEDWGFTEVSENNFGKFQLKKGDIIVARTGATIGVNRFINEDINAVFNNGLIKLKVNENKCLPKYLFYNLQSYNYWGYIDGISGGTSTQPNMQINALLKYEIQLPPLPEQKAIASVLSSLDDKIDLLHQQNQTLEALAETLFRQWFIEEAKEDWEDCTIEDLCIKINSGGTPSTKIDSYYNGNINWYSTKELNDNFLFSSNSKITQEGLDNSSAKIFPAGTVVIAIYAAPTVGRLGILTEDSAFNQAACGLVANDKICSKEFLYLYLKNQRVELNLMASGSAQQNLNVGKIKSYPCFVPDSITMEKFKFQVIPLFSKVLDNSKQIQTLTQIRDTLLSKLMSGEVRVKM
ncbi:restriction endonuclease subunit S [uncultured Weeksella sp.]|uniref:restriction endonuclease subunit S n=1 Tax=uncultured Weeksella sp. TaxID=1161389 RepID=UPI00259B0ABB|nr:restriction endonuclease subunit S [uncultured Weeksella sp.]